MRSVDRVGLRCDAPEWEAGGAGKTGLQWEEERRVGTGHWSEAEARSNCVVIDDGGADGSRIVSRMQNPPRDKMNGGIF